MIYDVDSERLEELATWFAAGEQRGRSLVDEDLVAQCVALRVSLAQRQAAAYREGLETAFWFVVILASLVVAAWVLVLPVLS